VVFVEWLGWGKLELLGEELAQFVWLVREDVIQAG